MLYVSAMQDIGYAPEGAETHRLRTTVVEATFPSSIPSLENLV